MNRVEELANWMKQGCQRRAVAQVLRKPMTTSEVCQAARVHARRIQLRDGWFLLRQFQSRGLVRCLNPAAVTGKLFVFSDLGEQAAAAAWGARIARPHPEMDWHLYSWVARASVRKRVLLELGAARFSNVAGLTPTQIKRNFRGRFPLGKNLILRALDELGERRLVESHSIGKRSRQRRSILTPEGRRIHDVLMA